MSLHVIVGAGAVGGTTARLLAERGEQVRLISRRGIGPQHPGIELVSADATDTDRLTTLTEGAAVLYNCANPPYDRWLTDWPPLAAAFLTAARRTGAVYAIAGNLYGYGPVTGPITPRTPLAATHPKLRLRADMWRDALAAHRAGEIRAIEVRGSDYIEANSIFSFVLAKPLLAGKRAWSPAPLDVPHTWTSTTDVARTLIAAAAAERGWGEGWLVPSHPSMTVREIATKFTEYAGAPAPKLSALPYPVLWSAGLFQPFIKELRTTHYQFTRPFIMDSTHTQQTFSLQPTDLDEAFAGIARPTD